MNIIQTLQNNLPEEVVGQAIGLATIAWALYMIHRLDMKIQNDIKKKKTQAPN